MERMGDEQHGRPGCERGVSARRFPSFCLRWFSLLAVHLTARRRSQRGSQDFSNVQILIAFIDALVLLDD